MQVQAKKYVSNHLAAATRANALAFTDGGTLFCGTDKGLLYLEGARFVALLGDFGEVSSLCPLPGGGMLAATGNRVLSVGKDCRFSGSVSFPSPVVSLKSGGNRVYALTQDGIYIYENGDFRFLEEISFPGASALAVAPTGEPYVRTDAGLMLLHGKRLRWSSMMPGMTGTPDVPVCCMQADGLGMLWLGTSDGVYIYDGKNEWAAPSVLPALVRCPIRALAFGSKGETCLGTDAGLYIADGERTRFFGCSRYLPGDRVYDIAVSPTGEIWAACENGLAVLSFAEMTLEEKAAYYESLLPAFIREGFLTSRWGTRCGDPATGFVSITDNDGLYTADQVASQSLRYAVTGDADALEKARTSMNALLRLHTVTGIPGFPARAWRRPGESRYGDGNPEWHAAADENGPLEWKGETSSDELVGHYYALCWYYDLCADGAEKTRIADALQKVTDHILSHGYTLCDADGLPTTWAHFGPGDLNAVAKWYWEKGVNSLELLSFLRITYHMTGEKRYLNELYRLAADEHYAMNLLYYKRDDAHSCHIDDRLCFYIVTHLLRLETDETLLRCIKLGVRAHYEYIQFENCPFYAFIAGLAGNKHADLNAAAQVLEDYPLDLRCYTVRNSIRADIETEPRAAAFGEAPHAKLPLPAGERVTGHLLVNAMQLDDADRGGLLSPVSWLHCYWLGRYLGYLL